ncbi:thiamine pyrophosphate-binding protein [Aerosakkonema funiforme]|uniref:thiamine pyrophosphate-binding protein n=1 Tax=Aerosakkonema funiforme TaxID=1246630 RepID=UPI0035B71749
MEQEQTSYYITLPSGLGEKDRNITLAQVLLKYLELEGVTKLFGIPSTAMKHLLNELKNQNDKFDYVICRQETGAAFIADGYFRVTGKLGVVLVACDAGLPNALTGILTAQHDKSALLVISVEPSAENYSNSHILDEVEISENINAVYRNICQYSDRIRSPQTFQPILTQALRNALAIPSRTTCIGLPDKLAGSYLSEAIAFPTKPEYYRAIPQFSSPHQVQQAFDYLTHAKQPLILLGNGCRPALRDRQRLEKFKSFVEKFAIPVMTTPDAKAIFPESHWLSFRNYGVAGCNWPKYYLESSNYDALMVMGSSLGRYSTIPPQAGKEPLIPKGALIQVDLDQSAIARFFPVQLGIVAEVGTVIDNLFELSDRTQADEQTVAERRALIKQIRETHSPFLEPQKRNSEAAPILPQALMKCINDNEKLRQGGHIFIDSGNSTHWAWHYLELDPPVEFHVSSTIGPMGFGTAGAIGGKIGSPNQVCVAITGDGGFMMQGNEISTAAQYNVGVVWVILYDNDLNMIGQAMNQYFPEPSVWKNYYQLGKPNLAKFAEGLGADAYEVRTLEEMRLVFAKAISKADTNNKPQAIVVYINTEEKPPW